MDDYVELINRLTLIKEWGVKLYLCGEAASPESIAGVLVREGSSYMPDFIYDEHGSLNEVYYDKVKVQ